MSVLFFFVILDVILHRISKPKVMNLGKPPYPKTQFTITNMYEKRDLEEEYIWCLEHLGLKDGWSLAYQKTQIIFQTSNANVVKKVNKHFNLKFNFINSFIQFLDLRV